jgi:protein-disulfide isomerase-like protein with CxxC motif
MADGYPAGQRPDGTEAQHARLRQMNEEIREETGQDYLTSAVHDGRHKYFFADSDSAVFGIAAALKYIEIKHAEVFHIGPPAVR